MKDFAYRNFRRFWIGGIILFGFIVILNFALITDVSPSGIGDHQGAGSADKINEIQYAWKDKGVLFYAYLGIAIDLMFIGIYSLGAFCGGILLRYDDSIMIKRVGSLVIAGAILFFITDYVETILQAIQLFSMQGHDDLAYIAASVRPAKTIAFLVTIVGLLSTILYRKVRN